jgi:hypothetical protein
MLPLPTPLYRFPLTHRACRVHRLVTATVMHCKVSTAGLTGRPAAGGIGVLGRVSQTAIHMSFLSRKQQHMYLFIVKHTESTLTAVHIGVRHSNEYPSGVIVEDLRLREDLVAWVQHSYFFKHVRN